MLPKVPNFKKILFWWHFGVEIFLGWVAILTFSNVTNNSVQNTFYYFGAKFGCQNNQRFQNNILFFVCEWTIRNLEMQIWDWYLRDKSIIFNLLQVLFNHRGEFISPPSISFFPVRLYFQVFSFAFPLIVYTWLKERQIFKREVDQIAW